MIELMILPENDQYETYVMYSLPQDRDVAVRNFINRFGYEPQEILNWFDRYLLVGPVKEEE